MSIQTIQAMIGPTTPVVANAAGTAPIG